MRGGEQDGGRAEHGQQRGAAGVGRAPVVPEDRGQDGGRTGPAQDAQGPGGERGDRPRGEPPGGQRDRRAGGELPEPGGGGEVAECCGLRRPAQAERQRTGADDQRDDPGHQGPVTRQQAAEAEQQDAPQDVELVLHAQRPEVLDGARVPPGGEVVGLLADEAPVGVLAGGGHQVAGQVGAAQRVEQQSAGDRGGDQHDGGGGQDPPGPAGGEVEQADAPGEQEPGDQEAGDHEEDVDADVSAGQPRYRGVEAEDGEDGDAAQAFDVGPEGLGGGGERS